MRVYVRVCFSPDLICARAVSDMTIFPPLSQKRGSRRLCRRFQWSFIRYLDGRVNAGLGINSFFPSFVAFAVLAEQGERSFLVLRKCPLGGKGFPDRQACESRRLSYHVFKRIAC